jgi:hypothetical protein
LGKEAFVATGVVSTLVVDPSRIIIYGATFVTRDIATVMGHDMAWLILAGVIAAFTGSFIGTRLMNKVTLKSVQIIVGVLLLLFSTALGAGLI